MGTPRGRKSKKSTFNFNSPKNQESTTSINREPLSSNTKLAPKKLDMSAHDMGTNNDLLVANLFAGVPTKLHNSNNVCFANSTFQAFEYISYVYTQYLSRKCSYTWFTQHIHHDDKCTTDI